MKTFFVVVASLLVFISSARAQEPELSGELKLKIQVQQQAEQIHQLEIQSAQCAADLSGAQAKLASAFLTTQAGDLRAKHNSLEKDLLKALGAKEGDTLDWSTTPPTLKHPDKPAAKQ